MSLWDSLCDNVLSPVGHSLDKSICSIGRGIDKAVNTVVIEGICGTLDDTIEYISENPIKSAAIVTTTVLTGGVAAATAPIIAGAVGSTGMLGLASTGTAINTLTGAALSNASLAALGGGALSAGGGGIALGTTVVTTTGGIMGGVASSVATKVID